MYAQIVKTLPDKTGDNWPIRQCAMVEFASECASTDDLYIVVKRGGRVVAFAQLCYKRHLSAYELVTLAGVGRGSGSRAFGAAYAIARAHNCKMIVFATNGAAGFYDRLKIWQSIRGNTYTSN